MISIPWAIFVLLISAITGPSFVPARAVAQRNACIANLKAIRAAKAEWAAENQKQPTDIPLAEELFGADKFLRVAPACPRGGQYTIGAADSNPTCTLMEKGHKLQ